jgi:hypothetical protein
LTTSYPDQIGEVVVSLVLDLGDTFAGLRTKRRWQLCLATWLYWHAWERATREKEHFTDDGTHTPAIATTRPSAHTRYSHSAGQRGASVCPGRDHFHP